MTDSKWTIKGQSLSHNNASKEFGIPKESLIDGMKSGTLQYHLQYAHGNPYYKLLRCEVEDFAIKYHHKSGSSVTSQANKHRLQKIETEIRSLRRKIVKLEKEKLSLET